ncbi:MAG TPA: YceI family protein [Gammaproteobacteria bacterium]
MRRFFFGLLLLLSWSQAGAEQTQVATWSLLPEASRLEFQFAQAGSDETGGFRQFQADFRFDPDRLEQSGIDVIVDMTSVETGDSERDQILRSADLFDVKRWPEARFKTTSITRREGNRYLAQAELTIRDQTRQIPFPFTLEISEKTGQEGQAVFRLTAEVPLKRLDFGVGKGDWAETTWISNEVLVQVDVQAQKQ